MSQQVKFFIFFSITAWASAFVAIRAGLVYFSPEGLALMRYLIASLFMLFVFLLRKKNIRKLKDILFLLILGALGIGIYNWALNKGELAVNSGVSSFIISQSPLITSVLSILFLNEKITWVKAFGISLSILGVGFITLNEIHTLSWNNCFLYLFTAAIVSGTYSLFQKPFLQKYNAIEVTTYLIWGGTLFLALFTNHLLNDWPHLNYHALLIVSYLGIFPAALGYLSWSYVLAEIPVSRASNFFYFSPFIATILGWIFLNEIVEPLSIFGGICSVIGIGLVNRTYKTPPV